jgi:excisionase family DNA binding protein
VSPQSRLSISEAAALTGVPELLLLEAVSSERLRFVRVGRRRVLRTTPLWIDAWAGTGPVRQEHR